MRRFYLSLSVKNLHQIRHLKTQSPFFCANYTWNIWIISKFHRIYKICVFPAKTLLQFILFCCTFRKLFSTNFRYSPSFLKVNFIKFYKTKVIIFELVLYLESYFYDLPSFIKRFSYITNVLPTFYSSPWKHNCPARTA